MRVEEYLQIITTQIRCKQAHSAVREELLAHVEDQKVVFIKAGMDCEEAELAAVKEMGDPVETGIALDAVHRPRMAWRLIVLVIGLSFVGFVVQLGLQTNLPNAVLIPRVTSYLFYLFWGFVLMLGICYFDYTRIARWARELTILLFFGLLFGLMFSAVSVNGANAWIYFFMGIALDIRKMAFLFIPLYGAILYHYRGEGKLAIGKGILWMCPALWVVWQCHSFVTGMILLLAFLAMLSAAISHDWFQVSKKLTLSVIGGFVLLLPILIYTVVMFVGADYQKMRIQIMLDPGSAANAGGYQMNIVRELLADSRMIGSSAAVFLPDKVIPAGSDYVLTYIISYYGILAAILLIGAILYLFLRLLRVSWRQKNQLGMVMGTGCASVFFIQMVFYILGNLGFLSAGVYCPFITYGGSGMVITYVLLGILLSIYRYQNVVLNMIPIKKRKSLSRLE